MAEINNPGEEKAWDILSRLDPELVCKAALVSYDPKSGEYGIKSFGMDFTVSVENRRISSAAPGSEALLQRTSYFFRLSVLWYLVSAKDIPFTGRLVKLQNLKGGDIFTKGSHVLPLDKAAQKYGKNKEGFIEKGKTLAGEPERLGDTSVRLYPLPRIPAVLTLWIEDEEFPARADLLFDSSCEMLVPMDILWSIAMMTVLVTLF